jgi:hypothetical protein
MAESHVVSALTAKRVELAGEIELTTRHLQQLRAALEQLDATLCRFDPAAVALVVMTARAMDTDNDRLVKLVAKRVGCCLRGQRDIGRAVSEEALGADGVVTKGAYGAIAALHGWLWRAQLESCGRQPAIAL